MKDEELLNAVFRFKHKTPSDNQGAATCVTLAKWFAAFTDKLEAVEVPEHKCGRVEPLADDRVVPASDFSVHEVEILQRVSQRLTAAAGKHKRGDVWYDPWLPMYGCVLQRTMLNATTVKLEVIFVDGWERTIHFLPGGECVHSAVPKTHHVLHCADLDTELEMRFGTAFASELQNAKLRRGSDRSAARNELGHQKTPQFIAAVVRRAMSAVMQGNSIDSIDCTVRGGTTDVGQHTGDRARDTCWALVQAVVAQNLCCGRGLFRKAMVTIELELLQMAVQAAESNFRAEDINLRDGCASIDDMFYMLQVIVLHAVDLLDGGYEVSVFQKECTELRSSIGGFVDIMNRQSATRYILPEGPVLQHLNESECGVEVNSPRRIKPENLEDSNTCHDRAWAHLEGCCFLDGSSCSLNKLLRWVKTNTSPASYKCILIMRTAETFMYTKSCRLCERVTDSKPVSLKRMQTLVTEYQAITRQWRQHPNLTSVLGVEQRSRETLILWIAFCLVHRQCVEELPLCSPYNIALDWKELKVLKVEPYDMAAVLLPARTKSSIDCNCEDFHTNTCSIFTPKFLGAQHD